MKKGKHSHIFDLEFKCGHFEKATVFYSSGELQDKLRNAKSVAKKYCKCSSCARVTLVSQKFLEAILL